MSDSNINPSPSFTPTPGTPRAAVGSFPYRHQTLKEADYEDFLRRPKACRSMTLAQWRAVQ